MQDFTHFLNTAILSCLNELLDFKVKLLDLWLPLLSDDIYGSSTVDIQC